MSVSKHSPILFSFVIFLALALAVGPSKTWAQESCSGAVLSVSADSVLNHISAKCTGVVGKQCRHCVERQAGKSRDLLRILMRMGACAPSPMEMKAQFKNLKNVLCPKSDEPSPEPEPSPSPEPSAAPPPPLIR